MAIRLDEAELKLLTDLLAEEFGLVFEGVRRDYLRSRLMPRLEALHLDNFLDYYHYLLYHPKKDEEHEHLRSRITNNETYFFRETHQFDVLTKHVLNDVKGQLDAERRPLRLLSAGCSSGEEPYSIGITLSNAGVEARGITWTIDACDLSPLRIGLAQRAAYERMSLRACDADQKLKYFELRDGKYVLKARHKKNIRFWEANLVEDTTGQGWGTYDAIFCRNVLIYLSEMAFHRVIDLFARLLQPKGTLFLGHSESLIGKRSDFVPKCIDGTVIYRLSGKKPGGA